MATSPLKPMNTSSVAVATGAAIESGARRDGARLFTPIEIYREPVSSIFLKGAT